MVPARCYDTISALDDEAHARVKLRGERRGVSPTCLSAMKNRSGSPSRCPSQRNHQADHDPHDNPRRLPFRRAILRRDIRPQAGHRGESSSISAPQSGQGIVPLSSSSQASSSDGSSSADSRASRMSKFVATSYILAKILRDLCRLHRELLAKDFGIMADVDGKIPVIQNRLNCPRVCVLLPQRE
jgi:hypothetical protein